MEKEDFTNVTEKNSPKEAKNQKLGRRPFLQGFRRGRLDEGWRGSKGSGHKKVISVLQESSFRGWEEKVVREHEHASARCAFGGGEQERAVSTMSGGRRDFIFLNGKELKIFAHEYERKY